MMERQLVYPSLQHGGTTIDSAEQQFPCMKVGIFQQKKKKNTTNIILARTYVHTGRKTQVNLLSRTEKRYLWLAAVDLRNCLSIIFVYSNVQKRYFQNFATRSLNLGNTVLPVVTFENVSGNFFDKVCNTIVALCAPMSLSVACRLSLSLVNLLPNSFSLNLLVDQFDKFFKNLYYPIPDYEFVH